MSLIFSSLLSVEWCNFYIMLCDRLLHFEGVSYIYMWIDLILTTHLTAVLVIHHHVHYALLHTSNLFILILVAYFSLDVPSACCQFQ